VQQAVQEFWGATALAIAAAGKTLRPVITAAASCCSKIAVGGERLQQDRGGRRQQDRGEWL
jgi:hypothetical protein